VAEYDFRYKGNMSEEQLLTFASTAVSRAAFNRTVLPSPALGRQLREETNGTILEYNRQIRTEVLRLSQADVAADYEHKVHTSLVSSSLRCKGLRALLEFLLDWRS
jgi:hypothetical protein